MKFNHTAHKALWDWLSNNTKASKMDWPGWERNGGEYRVCMYEFFACEFSDKNTSRGDYMCDSCPLVWPKNNRGNNVCDGDGGLYIKWDDAKSKNKILKLAAQIRDLPVRGGVECE